MGFCRRATFWSQPINAKLTAILQAIHIDPGHRGLARDPVQNLFNACRDDLASACQNLLDHPSPDVRIITGFNIPTANPPAWETDGPLGAAFLLKAFAELGLSASVPSGNVCRELTSLEMGSPTHVISIERVGPGKDGRCRTMRGRDITDSMFNVAPLFDLPRSYVTIGIGDGGNEIGMGKIPGDVVNRNIANGEQIHCQLSTDYLIVAGVSNWGAYALAAGLFVLSGQTPSAELFNEEAELARLVELVQVGKLVDGVTGQATATVDGLTWDQYITPLRHIRDVLKNL